MQYCYYCYYLLLSFCETVYLSIIYIYYMYCILTVVLVCGPSRPSAGPTVSRQSLIPDTWSTTSSTPPL